MTEEQDSISVHKLEAVVIILFFFTKCLFQYILISTHNLNNKYIVSENHYSNNSHDNRAKCVTFWLWALQK